MMMMMMMMMIIVIRVVGLSATLPNYTDVAAFLRVNPYIGLYFFDGRFRPVPLTQTFIGVKQVNTLIMMMTMIMMKLTMMMMQVNPMKQRMDMDEVCYDKCVDFLKGGHQVMVFVHARNATVNTAMAMKEMAQQNGETALFLPEDSGKLSPSCHTSCHSCHQASSGSPRTPWTSLATSS